MEKLASESGLLLCASGNKHLLNWAIPTDWLHSGEWESCGYSVTIDVRIEF